MTMKFQRATKKQAKARVAIYGPSGAGKTFSALRIATGMGGRIAVIDSERGSASKYADRFDFEVLEIPSARLDVYVEAIRAASGDGFDVLIIDSLSHAWHELLQEVERLAQAKYRGNTWSAWSEGTPKQRSLIDAILSFDGHVIGTMRAKTEWTQDDSSNGKKRPVRVGLAPEQGKGIEFEFDVLMSITPDHIAYVEKDRTGKFQDKVIEKPSEEFGQALADWLNDGESVEVDEKAVEDAVILAGECESLDDVKKHAEGLETIKCNQTTRDAIREVYAKRYKALKQQANGKKQEATT